MISFLLSGVKTIQLAISPKLWFLTFFRPSKSQIWTFLSAKPTATNDDVLDALIVVTLL